MKTTILKLTACALWIALLPGCPGGSGPADSQTGTKTTPILTSGASPIDTTTSIFGPWLFNSVNFQSTRTQLDFDLGAFLPGTYRLKIQNGNYGPFLASQCRVLTDAAAKKQCVYNNLIEKTVAEFTRAAKVTGTINGHKIFPNNGTLTNSYAYFEQPVELTANNTIIVNDQAYPTAMLRLAIDNIDPNAFPVSLFSLNSMSGTAPATIKFNASHSFDSNGSPLTFAWDFGDGNTSNSMIASNIYSSPGTYNAALTVTNSAGRSNTFSTQIVISAPGTPTSTKPPVLKLAVTYPDVTNLRKVHVSLASSYDLDGFITGYSIDFGDGTKVSTQEADHTYAADGAYSLKVKLTDDSNLSTSKTTSLSVSSSNNLALLGTVYGPKTYYGALVGTRNISESFTVPDNYATGTYRLTVENADGLPHTQVSCSGLSGAALLSCSYDNLVNSTYISLNRVSSATIKINGQAVTDSSSITQSQYRYDSIVQLSPSDTITYAINGSVTAYIKVHIEALHVATKAPPILTLQAPVSGAEVYANTSPASVQVIVNSDKTLASATVNGKVASILGSNVISLKTQFTQTGANDLVVIAKDLDGNSVTLNSTFNLNIVTDPPKLAFGLKDGKLLNTPSINLPITITAGAPVNTLIQVNGVQQGPFSGENISPPINLTQGPNVIVAQSTDDAGNISGIFSMTLNLDAIIPSLIQTTPANNSYVESPIFSISGVASKPLASISVNGLTLQLRNGNQFTGNYVAEGLGNQDLNFQFTDLAGNVSSSHVNVAVVEPLLVPNLVSVGLDKDGQHMWVQGAAGAARPGVTLRAYESLFGINRSSATSNSDGSFQIKLTPFGSVRLQASDPRWNQTGEAVIAFLGKTTLAGTVKDVFGNPLPNATVGLSNSTQKILTDNNGNFSISNPPTGDQLLSVDGSTVPQSTAGDDKLYSTAHVAVNIGLGQNNVLNGPVFMTPLIVDGSETPIAAGNPATVASDFAPGVEISIPADTTVFPTGTATGSINVMSVPSERATTPVPSMFVPTKVVSLEPSGTQFSEPVQLKLPNDNNLPAGTPMVIMSMNSSKGRWEIDGLAKVDTNGQNVVTNPDSGITHFSTVYAVPLAPLISLIQNPNLTGIDISQNGLTTSVSAPSFKVLGQTVTPSLTYKSAWANPTAMISALIQIPQPKTETEAGFNTGNFSTQSGFKSVHCWTVMWSWRECRSQWINVLQETSYTNFWQSTNMWIPDSIQSQFFVGATASDQVNFGISQNNSQQIQQLQGTPISNAAATQILTQTGIPTSAVVSYAIQLKDPATGDYMGSGIHPALGRFQVKLQNLTITTNTTSTSTNTYLDGRLSGGPQNNTMVATQISSQLLSLLPQDLKSDILLQNKTQSSAGRGWLVNGAERIYNPTNTKVMLEEPNGDVSTYALNNTITTLFDGNKYSNFDLKNGVDISYWPTASIVSGDASNNSSISQIDLSSPNSNPIKMGDLPSTTGKIANQGYASCGTYYNCDAAGCRNFYTGSFETTLNDYKTKFVAGGMTRSGDGQIFLTNKLEHSLYSYSGQASKISGTTQDIDSFVLNQNYGSSYFNTGSDAVADACINLFGTPCSNSEVVGTNNCDLANSYYVGHYEPVYGNSCYSCGTSGRDRCCDWVQVGSNWVWDRLQSAQNMFASSSGQIGAPGNDLNSLNSPTFSIGNSSGQIVISDTGNNRVLLYDPTSKSMSTLAGNGTNADNGDGGLAINAGIYHPQGLAYDSAGNLYISTSNGYIRKVDSDGVISTFAGLPLSSGGYYGDQSAANIMSFNNPQGMIFDSANQFFYVADSGNNRVLQINLISGIANNIAGNGSCNQGTSPISTGDGGPALTASLCNPTTVGLDDQNNLLIVDAGHSIIRRVTFNGVSGGLLAYSPTNNDMSRLFKNPDGSWTRQFRNGNVSSFDKDGLQINSKDRVGLETTFNYDSQSNLSQIQFPNGQSLTYNYSGSLLSSIRDPAGRITRFNYNSNLLSQATFPDGTSESFNYDDNGMMTARSDRNGNTTRYSYNQWNRLSSVQAPDGSIQHLSDYASQSVANNATDPNNPTQMKSPASSQGGLATQVTDSKGNVTVLTPDYMGFLSTITDSLGRVTRIRRDLNGMPLVVTFPDNTEVKYSYDPLTRDLLSTFDVGTGTTERKTYNSFGQVTTQTNGKGQTFVSAYDAQNGLILSQISPIGQRVDYGYNTRGQVTRKIIFPSESEQISTSYEYDQIGNIIRIVSSDGKESRAVYDLAGNQIQSISFTTGSSQSVTNYAYDLANRLTKVVTPNGEITQYTYLPTGELSSITDPKGKLRSFAYDRNGRLTQKTEPTGETYSFAYDANGNLTQEIDPNGNAKNYTYNELNQMVAAQLPDDLINYQYDFRGKVIGVSNNVSSISYLRDSKSRVTSDSVTGLGTMSDYPTNSISRTYDGVGNQIQMTHTYGSVSYNFDSVNRLTSLSNSIGYSFNYGFDSANRLTSITRPGSRSDYTYFQSGVVDSIIHSKESVTTAYSQYQYDLRNFPIQKRNVAGVTNYSYDGNGHLIGATGPNLSESFVYDSIGNRTADQLGSYSYDLTAQKLTQDWQYNYSYDTNGNMTARIPKDGSKPATTYTYNSKNQLTRVQITTTALGPVVKDISYNYDVLGRRMEKRVNDLVDPSKSFARRYLYDGDNIILEFDGASNQLAQYTHSPVSPDDVLSVNVTSNGAAAGLSREAGDYYYLKDALGSITEITNADGVIQQRYEYSAFGKVLSIKDDSGEDIKSNPVVNTSFTFTGREWDEESGLYFYRARTYNPQIGRFLQKDPDPGKLMNPITLLNKYAYAGNSPTHFRDPTGNSFLSSLVDNIVDAGHSLIAMIGEIPHNVLAAFGATFDRIVKSDAFFIVVVVATFIIYPGYFLAAAGSTALEASSNGDWSTSNLKEKFYNNLAITMAFSYLMGNPGEGQSWSNAFEVGIKSMGLTALSQLYESEPNFRANTNWTIKQFSDFVGVFGRLIVTKPPIPAR